MEANIWKMTIEQTKALRFGARVQAGTDGEKGTFLGVNRSGVVVVAWDNSKGTKEPQVMARLVEYALT